MFGHADVSGMEFGHWPTMTGEKNELYLGRTAVFFWGWGQRKCLVVGRWWLHVVVIVVAEAAKEGAENAPAPVLL